MIQYCCWICDAQSVNSFVNIFMIIFMKREKQKTSVHLLGDVILLHFRAAMQVVLLWWSCFLSVVRSSWAKPWLFNHVFNVNWIICRIGESLCLDFTNHLRCIYLLSSWMIIWNIKKLRSICVLHHLISMFCEQYMQRCLIWRVTGRTLCILIWHLQSILGSKEKSCTCIWDIPYFIIHILLILNQCHSI